ncbi:hypothetical protein [Streptomyces sp. NPDC048606]|uniref:hypothetical protein n=1 Tax=Streptomyces sp. NPDC048606 TaxID=3154726 RepID=UPI003422A37E
MRKALTLSAIVLASSMALGGTATAFAADGTPPASPSPTASPSGTPTPKPTPAPSTLRLSKDSGHPGDKVLVTVKTAEKDASVSSLAFAGGKVELKGDGKGTFTGTATVAADVKTGYYGVDAYAGGKKFDTVKFSTEAKDNPDVKPITPVKPVKPVKPVTPLKPSEHKTPKGSVNTGQAPADQAFPSLDV